MSVISRLLTVAMLLAPVLCLGASGRGRTPDDASASASSCEAAAHVMITRDDWGIAHVHGETDADTVFGAIYAQAEDDFNRIETNYLNALGRLAEAEGEAALYQDLRQRLFVDEAMLRQLYARSPSWLKALNMAWASGLNCFLASHPTVQPRVLRHFEPWMPLGFSEGSIGGDIERVALEPLRALYGRDDRAVTAWRREPLKEPSGSNGIAIAPENSATHHALLLINPHTSFYFRSELQMTSDQGLNAYGASTWGQFFIYQGFNDRLGWMHTSSGVDNVDFFRETVRTHDGRLQYRFGKRWEAITARTVDLAYRDASGQRRLRTFTTYGTHHGPVIAEDHGQWITIALMQKPIEALSQSYLLTKAHDYAAFMKIMALQANSSNNTIYADADGNIAYLHPQFIPRRDDRFDYTHPVDGSDPATDWRGLHALEELPRLLNPANGWIMNTNNWPYSAAGSASPRREDFPKYMDTAGENPRGQHATMLLTERRNLTLDDLNRLAFDPYLPAFAKVLPPMIAAYDSLPATHELKGRLSDLIAVLRVWDDRWSVHSVATTLAVLWGDELWDKAKQDAEEEGLSAYDAMLNLVTPEQKMAALDTVRARLLQDFGTWRVPWGRINRFQRLTGDIVQPFTDQGLSTPVGFTSSRWGSLASFGARRYPGTAKYYGTSGNSFVAMVEFGPKITARAVTAGGESGHSGDAHFADQIERYTDGSLRDVYFYPESLIGHTERRYRPE